MLKNIAHKIYRHYHSNSLIGRNFLSLRDYDTNDIEQLLWSALDLKDRIKVKDEYLPLLRNKNITMIFQKRSTRTRLSIETAVATLSGHPIYLNKEDAHLGVNESLKDTAKVISTMCNMVIARVYDHGDLETLAANASIPIVNALSDFSHPLQILADFMTIHEHFGYLNGLKLAWIGDGNNILHSLLYGSPKVGIDINFCTPKDYQPHQSVVAEAQKLSQQYNTKVESFTDPNKAIEGANIIVTDTWISMGQEEEKEKRLRDFKGYQIDKKMTQLAAKDWVFLHCLPRKKEEVTDEVFYSDRSLVWQEAENRKWTVMSVIVHHISPYYPRSFKPFFSKLEEDEAK